MASATRLVPLDEYLRTSYRPDVEFVDGILVERAVGDFKHGVAQGLVGSWFLQYRKEWGISAALGVRTRVSAGRVRLPDVVVIRRGEGKHGVLDEAPLIAIEVLAPADKYVDLRGRATDLWAMGTRNIWLVDPRHRRAEVWSGRQWQVAEVERLEAPDGPMYLDLNWLWAELDDDLEVAES